MNHAIKTDAHRFRKKWLGWLCAALLAASCAAQAAWEPSGPITFVVSGGLGGGADQMARLIQAIATKHRFIKHPMVVVVESGGGGAQAFIDIKKSKGDARKIMIALTNLFSIPLATTLPFSWKDTTPVALMALDQFVLWVNAKSPYQTTHQYIEAVRAQPGNFKMGVVGGKREDSIVTALIEQSTGVKFTEIPYSGGGQNATQLVGGHTDSNVNNPIENIAYWRAGQLRPLCVFDEKRMPFKTPIANGMSWYDVPTCRESGINATYQMMRGIFMPQGVTQEQVAYYVGVLKKVKQTPEWQDFVNRGAYNDVFLTGKAFREFVEKQNAYHHDIMMKAGFIAK